MPLATNHRPRCRRLRRGVAGVLALATLAGCSGGGGSGGAEVASLGSSAPAVTADDGDGAGDGPDEADLEEAMLDFTECMRDHGIDMPDPQVSGTGDGGVMVVQEAGGEGQPEFERDSEAFEAAQRECEHFMEDVVGDIEIDPERQAEMQEEMLEFARCMREHGIDMPDPVFGEDGRVEVASGDVADIGSEQFEVASEACGGGMFRAAAASDGGDG